MTRVFTFLAAFILSSSVALAAPGVPGRGQMKGDIVKMNQQFHITGYNYRIKAIRWVPATDPFAQGASSYAGTATAPNGYLVFEVPAKNTQSEEDWAPNLTVTALYKDGTMVDGDQTPFSKTGNPLTSRKVFPGQGITVYYTIANVPQPTKGNPLVKLILKYTANNDPGYPPVYRLLHPVVSP